MGDVTSLLAVLSCVAVVLTVPPDASANGNKVVSSTYWDRDRTLDGTRAPVDEKRPAARVFRIFVDEDGDLYTADPHRDHPEPCVRGYFFRSTRGKIVDCDRPLEPADARTWTDEQERLTRRIAKAVSDALTQTDTRMLFVLVHGFNVSDASGDYLLAETLIDGSSPSPKPTIFLEVHWDGQRFKRELWTQSQWSSAQVSAPLVGIRLRSLVNLLPGDLQVNVLTHSLGGLVAATLIGDSTGMFEKQNLLRDFLWPYRDKRTGPFAIPDQSMRLALLAPATGDQSLVGNRLAKGMLARHVGVLLGINPTDEVLQKNSIPVAGASSFGFTRLGTGGDGCNTKHPTSCVDVQEVMRLQPKRAETVRMVAFDQPGKEGCLPKDHDFFCYLTRVGFDEVRQFLWGAPTAAK